MQCQVIIQIVIIVKMQHFVYNALTQNIYIQIMLDVFLVVLHRHYHNVLIIIQMVIINV